VAADREVGLFISNAGADSIGSSFLKSEIGNWESLVVRNVMTVMRNCHHLANRCARAAAAASSSSGRRLLRGSPHHCLFSDQGFRSVFRRGSLGRAQPYGVDVLSLILGRTDTPAFRDLMTRKAFHSQNLAAPEDVARIGLARLPHGPVHNWGWRMTKQLCGILRGCAARANSVDRSLVR